MSSNLDDPRYLTELAFKNIIETISGLTVFITSDRTPITHPCVLARVMNQAEELAPGTGIFKQRVELELKQKLDSTPTEEAEEQVRRLRQALYRNDNSPNPMKDLAIRLTKAVSQPYTCFGVVPSDEAPVSPDSSVRVYSYFLAFDVHVTPTR